MKRKPNPPPELPAELYEALDALESGSRELRRQKRELLSPDIPIPEGRGFTATFGKIDPAGANTKEPR